IELRQDHCVVRIPVAELIALLNSLSFLDAEDSTIGYVVGDQYAILFLVDNTNFTGTSHNNTHRVVVVVGCFDDANAFKLNNPRELSFDVGFHGDVRRSTPYVEGTECKLCTRFTDRLCRDDTDGLTRLYHVSGSEVSSVAFRTTTDLRLTSEQRADFNLL